MDDRGTNSCIALINIAGVYPRLLVFKFYLFAALSVKPYYGLNIFPSLHYILVVYLKDNVRIISWG